MKHLDENLRLIWQVARQIHRYLPHSVEIGDLIGDGYFGLVRARRRFDPSRGVPFRAFARRFIHGAILDGLRRRDWLPRWLRKSENPPRIFSFDGDIEDPSDRREYIDRRESVYHAMGQLPARERMILQLYYLHSMPMKQVGKWLGITESRVSQLRAQAIQLLREVRPI